MSGRWGRPLVRLDACESTNDLARLLAASGLPEGATVVARTQTRGRGRQGRVWISPEGGLWASLLLRPAVGAGWGRLALAIAVAVAETIEQAAAVRADIRWPNDVLVAGRKVAGVLLEGVPDAIIAGLGINANVAAEQFPAEVRDRAGSLHALTGRAIPLHPLLDTLLDRCGHWYTVWGNATDAAVREILEAWSDRDAVRGQRVVVHGVSGDLEGIAEGIDGEGALRLRTPEGTVRAIMAGDLVPVAFAQVSGETGRSTPSGV